MPNSYKKSANTRTNSITSQKNCPSFHLRSMKRKSRLSIYMPNWTTKTQSLIKSSANTSRSFQNSFQRTKKNWAFSLIKPNSRSRTGKQSSAKFGPITKSNSILSTQATPSPKLKKSRKFNFCTRKFTGSGRTFKLCNWNSLICSSIKSTWLFPLQEIRSYRVKCRIFRACQGRNTQNKVMKLA